MKKKYYYYSSFNYSSEDNLFNNMLNIGTQELESTTMK